jgi:thermitase
MVGLLLGMQRPAPLRAGSPDWEPPFVPGELIVGLEPGILGTAPAGSVPGAVNGPELLVQSGGAAQALTGLDLVSLDLTAGSAVVSVTPGEEMQEAARLAELPGVAYAEPNYIAQAAGSPVAAAGYPSDPLFGDQWSMRRVKGPEAWDVTTGRPEVLVAIIDSGIDLEHPEFAGRLTPGYDYVQYDEVPQDEFGHGTHVAGIVGAAANNNAGVTGLAPHVSLLPLRVLDSAGYGSYDSIASAVEYATLVGARVINLSLGGIGDSTRLKQAIAFAVGKGVLVTAASGNCAQFGYVCGSSTPNPEFYPAAYAADPAIGAGVLAVAASDHYDVVLRYSGFKPYVGLAAPGGIGGDAIWSTALNGYGQLYGTSMSTGLASGAAALAWGLKLGATGTEIAQSLKATADKTGFSVSGQPLTYPGGRNDYFGYGRLNAQRLVRWLTTPAITPIPPPPMLLAQAGGPALIRRFELYNPSDQTALWQASVVGAAPWLTLTPGFGNASYTAPGFFAIQIDPARLEPGEHVGIIEVKPTYPAGLASFRFPVRVLVASTLHRQYVPGVAPALRLPQGYDPDALPGTPLALADNAAARVELPFPVRLFDRSYQAIYVSDNGWISFSPPAASAHGLSACLPSASAPNAAVYALWSDFKPAFGGSVRTGQSGDDTFDVTWFGVKRFENGPASTFQATLRRDGPITLTYYDVDPTLEPTIGAENYDGTVAEQVHCGIASAPITPGDFVDLDALSPW